MTNDKCCLKIQRGSFERCAANGTGPFVQSTWTFSTVSSVKFAMTADIEVMIMQVGSKEKDRDVLRFLWSDNEDERTSKYQRLIIRETCYPACAFFFLQKCAEDNRQQKCSTQSQKQFYMDDFIQIFSTRKRLQIQRPS